MIYRAIALSLAILVGLGTILPLVTLQVEAGSRNQNGRKRKARNIKNTQRNGGALIVSESIVKNL